MQIQWRSHPRNDEEMVKLYIHNHTWCIILLQKSVCSPLITHRNKVGVFFIVLPPCMCSFSAFSLHDLNMKCIVLILHRIKAWAWISTWSVSLHALDRYVPKPVLCTPVKNPEEVRKPARLLGNQSWSVLMLESLWVLGKKTKWWMG